MSSDTGERSPHQDREVAYMRLILSKLEQVEREVGDLSFRLLRMGGDIGEAKKEISQLRAERLTDAKKIREHSVLISRLRLDRQILRLPKWFGSRLKQMLTWRIRSSASTTRVGTNPTSVGSGSVVRQLVIIAPKYPSSESPYGGQAVERRVKYYVEAGYDVTVFVPSGVQGEQRRDGIEVVRAPLEALSELIESARSPQICIHHPVPDVWKAVRPYVDRLPLHVWIHGFEARNWRDLSFNYSAQEIRERGSWLDAVNVERRLALQAMFCDARITKIFVSQFMQGVAESFANQTAINSSVIHNVIDPDVFCAREKGPSERTRILAVRSFAGLNYGTDLILRTIRRLTGESWFSELRFEIRGDGKRYEEDTEGLEAFENVSLQRKIVSVGELVNLHAGNGVMLIPTRWDSQGMTMGEAMSSGLVPVTNAVTAIPEFLDSESGVLAGPEDVEGLAAGIRMIYENPLRFTEMSRSAAARVRSQCRPEVTVAREIAIFDRAARV